MGNLGLSRVSVIVNCLSLCVGDFHPAAITSGLATAAKRGALIKGGAALEQLGKVEVMAFDKTGTLTQGKPTVTDVIGLDNLTQDELLSLAGAIETGSNHPLAKSLLLKAQQQGVILAEATDKQTLAGVGVQGKVQGQIIRISSPSKLSEALTLRSTRPCNN